MHLVLLARCKQRDCLGMASSRLAVLLAAVLLILIFTLGASPSAAQIKGFQSINCGGGNLIDPLTGIKWEEDPFTNETNEQFYGRASEVYSGFDNVTSALATLRYFPRESTNTKFCYTLQVSIGNTYLVRASFLYGNYDKFNQPPTFSLIINYDIWTNVTTSLSSTPIIQELTFVSKNEDLNICLAPISSTNHTPFISTLELRPLANTMYIQNGPDFSNETALSQGYGLQLWRRIHYGAKTLSITRFPDDQYDRIWEANTTGPTVGMNASDVGLFYGQDPSQPPAKVLATAITTKDPTGNLSFTYEGLGSVAGVRMEMHFEEVDERALQGQTQRQFYIAFPNSSYVLTENSLAIDQSFPIEPAQSGPISIVMDQNLQLPIPFQITFFPVYHSPFGPLLNAIELFHWTPQVLSTAGTFSDDVYAIMLIQTHFKLSGYGQGDPCTPKGYKWTWIGCNDDAPPRITEINLASLNLAGDIPPSISNLSFLQKIDLSHNMLTGSIPDINNLHDLIYLDVSYNNLCGSPPSFQTLVTFKHTGNTGLCDGQQCACSSSTNSSSLYKVKNITKKYIVALCTMGATYIVLLMIFLIFYKARNIKKMQEKAAASMGENKKGFGFSLGSTKSICFASS